MTIWLLLCAYAITIVQGDELPEPGNATQHYQNQTDCASPIKPNTDYDSNMVAEIDLDPPPEAFRHSVNGSVNSTFFQNSTGVNLKFGETLSTFLQIGVNSLTVAVASTFFTVLDSVPESGSAPSFHSPTYLSPLAEV